MDKPLHVRVAEALGEVRAEHNFIDWDGDREQCLRCDYSRSWGSKLPDDPCIPRYDTDWSATGPLIERHQWHLSYSQGAWWADGEVAATGETPLIAVCNLILALHAAGKLAA